MYKFPLGRIFKTCGINNAIKENKEYVYELFGYLVKYINGDWGDLSSEDKLENEYALEHNDRILGAYSTSQGKIYIITEYDRSYTTILFANEY